MKKEICNKLTEESFEKIKNLDKRIGLDKLVFKYKGNTPDEDFRKFDNALDLINKISDGEISLNEAMKEQAKLKQYGENKKSRKKIFIKREQGSKNKY